MPMDAFDLKALASEACRFNKECILKYRGGNSHEAVAVVQVVEAAVKWSILEKGVVAKSVRSPI